MKWFFLLFFTVFMIGVLVPNHVYSEEGIGFKIDGISSSVSFENQQQKFYFDAPTIFIQTWDGSPLIITIDNVKENEIRNFSLYTDDLKLIK
ncbi:MAG: hypothetical protein JKY53_14995 [Flavobacteriales bacterium]|nr:hypothetical protein [Flavobacteriales bacterium]